MKIKLFFSIALVFLGFQLVLAQDKEISLPEMFNKWKQGKSIKSEKNGSEFLYFSASAKKVEQNIAVIDFGIVNFKKKLTISATPLVYEKNADGTWKETVLAQAGKLQMLANEESLGEFVTPSMKVSVQPEANAVRLNLWFDDETQIKTITIKLTEKTSTGVLTSL